MRGAHGLKRTLAGCLALLFLCSSCSVLKEETAERFLESMEMQKAPLGCVFCGGESGNPAWFSKPYFSELKELSGDRGGKKVLKRHWESVIPFRVEAAWELKDLDRKEDLCCRDTGGCHE